ncbi:hypothetical protein [Clostridium aminobutyricum]|uniref:DUF3953 domain-containing protein n=1 Tax=Clostridium aminobutyricum TaxID=33953 RepID=A0A939IK40_CLOAM|nr:hypothetical protein [Clostridium aminobutyricum]MBN7774209.1 hypothetical protein [Clostridium aminobutyricum]
MEKQKLFKNIMIIAGIVAIAYMGLNALKGIRIPGFLPFTFVVLMAAMYKLEEMGPNKRKNKMILIIIMVLEVVAGIMQITAAMGN